MPKNPSYIPVPSVAEFMSKKNEAKTEPPWVFLEREMKENAEKGIKPYNKKVGDWLKFLKDLKEYFEYERNENLRKMDEDIGPSWFIQFSPSALNEVDQMGKYVHQDVMSNTYEFSQKALRRMGITTKFTESMLETAIRQSGEDAGVFLWTLYTLYYKTSPSEPLPRYSTNAKLLMSAIMFIDLPICIKRLDLLTNRFVYPPKPAPKKTKSNYKPSVKFGEYLAEEYVTRYKTSTPPKPKHPEVDYRLRLWEEPNFKELARKSPEISLDKRRQKYEQAKVAKPVCTYKFWAPPLGALLANAAEKDYMRLATKVFKNKPKLPPKLPNDHIQCNVGTVSYTGERPEFQVHGFVTLPTNYLLHNGGYVKWDLDHVIHILGYIKQPADPEKCEDSCKCMDKWPSVQKHLAKTKCKCGHRYCIKNDKPTNRKPGKYFKPPTKYGPFTVDENAIADIGSRQNFIETEVEEALKSVSSLPASIIVQNLRTVAPKFILMSLFADLMDSSLLIPHMPRAYMLPSIQAWIRRRIKGPIGPKLKRQLESKTKRSWLYLKRTDFKVRAHRIPYSVENMPKYNFSHRYLIQEIREKEFEKLAEKTKQNMLLESRLLWATMRSEDFPMEKFLRTFYAYMPDPGKKMLIYAPVVIPNTKKGRTCPLEKPVTID